MCVLFAFSLGRIACHCLDVFSLPSGISYLQKDWMSLHRHRWWPDMRCEFAIVLVFM